MGSIDLRVIESISSFLSIGMHSIKDSIKDSTVGSIVTIIRN